MEQNNREHLLDYIKDITSQLPMEQVSVSLNPVDPYNNLLSDEDIHGDLKDTASEICNCYKYLKDTYNTDPKIWRLNCGINSLVQWSFDTEGSIYKCPALTGEPQRAVTNVYQNHMNSSFYKTINHTLENEECLSCSYFGLCYGGCPRQKELTHTLSCKKSFFEEYISKMIELKYGIKNEFRKESKVL